MTVDCIENCLKDPKLGERCDEVGREEVGVYWMKTHCMEFSRN